MDKQQANTSFGVSVARPTEPPKKSKMPRTILGWLAWERRQALLAQKPDALVAKQPVTSTTSGHKRPAVGSATSTVVPAKKARMVGADDGTIERRSSDTYYVTLQRPVRGMTPGAASLFPVPEFPTFPASPTAIPPPGVRVSEDDATTGTVHVDVDSVVAGTLLSAIETSLHWLSEDDDSDDVNVHSSEPCRYPADDSPVRVTYVDFPPRRSYYVAVRGLLGDGRGWTPYMVKWLPSFKRIPTAHGLSVSNVCSFTSSLYNICSHRHGQYFLHNDI